jgi:Domain of unknown function (DUF5666)
MLLRRVLVASGLALCCLTSSAFAQETARVRGSVERFDGNTLYVKARDGADLKIALADKPVFTAIVKASLADVKPGTYVGATAMPGPEGGLRAVEVHIFPEAMRGTGEGHYPWDLQPESMMTNATVATVASASDGQTLKLDYKDGTQTIHVKPGTPVVTFAPGQQSDAKPGAKVFIGAMKAADGTLTAQRLNVGKDGMTPPM